jgi:pimeloyl-ACP methyl ester carboxylesterase
VRQIVRANGVDLCVETIGDPGDPPILLIMGNSGSMDWWETEFRERLVAGGRFVIRYDLRDTGESVTYEAGTPPYTGDDLIADAVGVLDALDLRLAHVVGISMGGALAQLIAIEHGDRVASLTLISTSPAGPGEDDLPGMSEEALGLFGGIAEPDWSDRDAAIAYVTELGRAAAARSEPFDEDAMRTLAGTVFDRSINIASSYTNHHRIDGPGRWRERLGEIRAPTVVLHGDEDPVFAIEHGAALAREIPGAELVRLEGVGHELPRRAWDEVVAAIVRVSARA